MFLGIYYESADCGSVHSHVVRCCGSCSAPDLKSCEAFLCVLCQSVRIDVRFYGYLAGSRFGSAVNVKKSFSVVCGARYVHVAVYVRVHCAGGVCVLRVDSVFESHEVRLAPRFCLFRKILELAVSLGVGVTLSIICAEVVEGRVGCGIAEVGDVGRNECERTYSFAEVDFNLAFLCAVYTVESELVAVVYSC